MLFISRKGSPHLSAPRWIDLGEIWWNEVGESSECFELPSRHSQLSDCEASAYMEPVSSSVTDGIGNESATSFELLERVPSYHFISCLSLPASSSAQWGMYWRLMFHAYNIYTCSCSYHDRPQLSIPSHTLSAQIVLHQGKPTSSYVILWCTCGTLFPHIYNDKWVCRNGQHNDRPDNGLRPSYPTPRPAEHFSTNHACLQRRNIGEEIR